MKKLYVSKDEKGRYLNIVRAWSKDINKADVFDKRAEAKNYGQPVRVNIVEAQDD